MTQIANLITTAHINTNGSWSAANGGSTGIHSSASSTEYVYTLVNPNWTFNANDHTFKYCNDSSSSDYQKWMDVGSANPLQIADGLSYSNTTSTSANPQIVSFWSGNTLLFAINNPYYTTSSGSGTGTNTGVGFTASFYDVTNNSFSYEVTHTSGFTSDQTYELHSTTLTPTFISDLVVGAASGSTNSRSHTWGTPDVIQVRDAYGTIGAELTLAHSSSSSSNGKVFCNFW